MNYPQDLLDIILNYTGDVRLLGMCKNKKKLKFYIRKENAILNIEKYVIRYKCQTEQKYINVFHYYINNNNDYFFVASYFENERKLNIEKFYSYYNTKNYGYSLFYGTRNKIYYIDNKKNTFDIYSGIREQVNEQIRTR